MSFGDYVTVLWIYGLVIVGLLWGSYGLACLALKRWGGEEWRERS